jgi:SWI/SNF-related matrix-associated actin-dependent regulator 1 of chromatin subfamily A
LGQELNGANPPGTLDKRLHGHNRRIPHGSSADFALSSEELTSEDRGIFESPSKPPNVAQLDPHTPAPSGQADIEDPKLTRFALTMPQHRKDVVRLAWQQTNGDARKASDMLQDPVWLRNPSGSTQPSPEVVGRVKEIDEATKAQRAAAREIGKNSLIYANRPAPHISTPPTSKITFSVVSSPLSPDVSRPRVKRTKKIVVDSDSDTEAEDICHISKRQKVTSDESRALGYFNTAGSDGLQELTGSILILFCPFYKSDRHFSQGCTPPQAVKIIELRPFHGIDDLNTKLGQGRKKAGPGGISPRMFEDCITIFQGYGMVDGILEDCEEIGASLRDAIASWTLNGTKGKGKLKADLLDSEVSSRGSPAIGQVEDGALSLLSIEDVQANAAKDFIATQPSLLREGTVLKDYQLLGVNWLNLLYRRNLSCILADDMGVSIC